MIVRDGEWEEIRESFTEAEKLTLRAHVRGETICPRGIAIDENSSVEVVQKLVTKVRELRAKI